MSKEKQIEEMAKVIARRSKAFRNQDVAFMTTATKTAESLYNAGYRKQKEVGWIVSGMFDDFLKCSSCGYQQPWQTAIEYKYCPNCGAKMKGGAE